MSELTVIAARAAPHRCASRPAHITHVMRAPVTLQHVSMLARQLAGRAALCGAAGRAQAAGTALLIAGLAAWPEPVIRNKLSKNVPETENR